MSFYQGVMNSNQSALLNAQQNMALAQYQNALQGYGNYPSTISTGVSSGNVVIGQSAWATGASSSNALYFTDNSTSGTYSYSTNAPAQKATESNIAWLNRRVEEMRVRL